MATIKGNTYSTPKNINLGQGMLRFNVTQSSNPFTNDDTGYGLYINSSSQLVFWNATTTSILGGGGSLVNYSLNDAYDDGSDLVVDAAAVSLSGSSDGAINMLEITLAGAGTGNMIDIENSTTGSAGSDIIGTGNTWSVSSAGSALLVGITGCDTIVAAANLALDATGTGTIAIGGTSTGTVTVTPALVATASVTITGSADSDVFVITDGDALIDDGHLSITETDTATPAINIASSATGGNPLEIVADALTGGAAIYVDSDNGASFTGTGGYLNFYNGTASVFHVGQYGALTILGNAEGTDAITCTNGDITLTDGALVITAGAFTYTAGDMAMGDGSVSITDADNANTLVVVNNTITTADLVDMSSTSITTGALMKLNSNAATADGEVLEIISAGDATSTPTGLSVTIASPTTGAAKGINVVMAGATTTAVGLTVNMAALTTGTCALLTTAGVYTGTNGVLAVTAAAATTGNIVVIDGTGLTTGTGLLINATTATLTSGFYIECNDGAASDFTVGDNGATVIAGSATGTDALTLTLGDITLGNGDATLTDGDIILAANASSISFTGTGANGGVLTNLKNEAAASLSGTDLTVEIDIGGTPYYFLVSPTKT